MRDFIKQRLREELTHERRLKFDIPIPKDIQQIQAVFHKNNHKLYVVGGAVRDALLGKIPKDYDLATDAVPDKVEAMMKTAGFRTLPTGKAFGVINVFTNEGEYEVATFREDGLGRKPEVKIGGTIQTDCARRDLTMNALYYDVNSKEIIDLVGGIEDIKNRVVRTVGDPEARFTEDPLRILRYFRMLSRI